MTASVTFVFYGRESHHCGSDMTRWGALLHRLVGAEPAPAAGGTHTRCGLRQVQDLHGGGLKVLRPGWAR